MTNNKSDNSHKLEEGSFMSGVAILETGPESPAQKAGLEKGDVIIEYAGVTDLTIDTLPDLIAGSNRCEKTVHLVFMRDGTEHLAEVPPGPLGISAANTTVHGITGPRSDRNRILKTVRAVQTIYLVLMVLGCIAAVLSILLSVSILSFLKDVAFVIIYGTAYLGLRYRKEWVITLILILSALNCFSLIFPIFIPAETASDFWAKLISLFMFFFFAYNIVLFRRSAVRSLFRDKGTVVF